MDDGQVSMDFLMAITIFALGLVLLISQVPMLFAPLQTVSTDIQPVAYRTSMILVEDGGIYNETTGYITSNWEDPEGTGENYSQNCINITNYTDNVKRIGLAMSTMELEWSSSSEDIVPNTLSVNKTKALQDWWSDGTSTKVGNSSLITAKLGLNVTYNGRPVNYSYNISLVNFSDNLIPNSSAPLLLVGDSIPTSGSITIEKIERIVAIDNPPDNCTPIGDAECAKLVVCVWR